MGGKKKGGDKKKAAKDDVEDLSVENFFKTYTKNCAIYGCEKSKYIKSLSDKYNDEPDIKPHHIKTNEELGWPGIKAITESLKQVKYPHLVSLRLWKTYIEDEGVRAVCEFLQ